MSVRAWIFRRTSEAEVSTVPNLYAHANSLELQDNKITQRGVMALAVEKSAKPLKTKPRKKLPSF